MRSALTLCSALCSPFSRIPGSALPGPLVWEIEKEGQIVRVDGVVTVVDCANFARINNFSRTAKIQAKCTDLVLLNKVPAIACSHSSHSDSQCHSPPNATLHPLPLSTHSQVELASEDLIEQVLDDLNELVPEVPKLRTQGDRACTDPGVLFGLDAALWRSSSSASGDGMSGEGAGGEGAGGGDVSAGHMAADAECYHVLPSDVPHGWSATRACLEALMKSASADELYRSKGVVPLAFAEAAAEAARQGLPPPTTEQATQLGDTWWLFNGVAGRLTLEPLTACGGPTSMVFMGQGLKLLVDDIEKALALPKGSVTNAGTLDKPKPKVKVQIGGPRIMTCGVARGLSVFESVS